MFLGAFGEYCIVQDQQAIAVPKEIAVRPRLPDRLRRDDRRRRGAQRRARSAAADAVMVIGCGAVGLSAVQGARLAGAAKIIAVDLDDAKLALARRWAPRLASTPSREDAVAVAKKETAAAASIACSRRPAAPRLPR